jgi:type IV secretion system protein VirB2
MLLAVDIATAQIPRGAVMLGIPPVAALASHRAEIAAPRTEIRSRNDAERLAGPARVLIPFVLLALCAPEFAFAQASPFMTGATSLQSNILAWLTPIAIILVMVLGGMAMANRMSWGWCLGAILGIAIAFGAPQIVTWVRGMFGV